MSTFHGSSDIIRNCVVDTKYPLPEAITFKIRTPKQKREPPHLHYLYHSCGRKIRRVKGGRSKSLYYITYPNCFSEVSWIIRIFKGISPN